MAANDYQLVTRWRLQARIEEVAEILAEPLDLPRWWPAVFLDAREIEPGGGAGIGRVIELFTTAYIWSIRAEKPLLRLGSFLLRPVFAANHRWAMEQGERSLALEVRRRRGEVDVGTPPQPRRWRAVRIRS